MATATQNESAAAETVATGRRKSAVARVRIRSGDGKIVINQRPLEDYFTIDQDRNRVVAPLELVGKRTEIDIRIRVHGGGNTGQAGACLQGIARALVLYDAELHDPLRESGFLTRDARMKERKKCGLHGARRGTQFSKR
ncbi:MAG: 30S ribosomal protein S9 [Pirellulales bacterium]